MALTPSLVVVGAVAANNGSTSAAAPTFGGTPTQGNLLVATVQQALGLGGGNFTVDNGVTGWTRQVQNTSRSQVGTAIFYKVAGSSETEPTFRYSNNASVRARLWEFKNCRKVSPVDHSSSDDAAGSVSLPPAPSAINSGADAEPPCVVISSDSFSFSSNYTHTSSDTYNNGATPSSSAGNDATSTRAHFRMAYGITTGNSAASRNDPSTDQVGTASVMSTCFVSFKPALSISANAGSMAITGAAATLKRALKMVATPSSFALTGFATTLSRGIKANATPGSVVLTGFAATLKRAYKMSATPAFFVITGDAATLQRAYKASLTPASVVITGAHADLVRALYLSGDPGSIVITPEDIVVVKGKALFAEPGNIAVTVEDITTVRELHLALAAGAMVITGKDAVLSYGYRTDLLAGSIAIVGFPATSHLVKLFLGGTPGFISEQDLGHLAEITRGRLAETDKG